jgi:hypothetical protein
VTLWRIRRDRKELDSTNNRIEHSGSERDDTDISAAPSPAASVAPLPIQSQTVTATASSRAASPAI